MINKINKLREKSKEEGALLMLKFITEIINKNVEKYKTKDIMSSSSEESIEHLSKILALMELKMDIMEKINE